MQAGTLEPTTSAEYSQKARAERREAAPVVGASAANAVAAESKGAQVELQIVAVNLASAVSAAAESRSGEAAPHSGKVSLAPPSQGRSSRSAANLKLSFEAQRLALIPAQVMAPDEIAAAREEVVEAQEALDAVRATRRREEEAGVFARANQGAKEPSSPKVTQDDSPKADPASPATLRAPASQVDPRAEMNSTETKSSAQGAALQPSEAQELQQGDGKAGPERFVSGETAPPASVATASERRPQRMAALSARSPFESSSPGATGQSVDIVVGGEP